jgi:NAD(P)H-nitrite reductase large subunit
MSASYVIVGDGIAGSSAAETLCEAAPDAEITVLTDEGEPLYNRILTKEYAKGRLPEAPIAIHDERWYDERGVDLRLNTLVTEIDTDANAVRTHGGERIAYDKLLIAVGGTPSQLPVENADAEGVHHFWTFEDARAIRAAAEAADTGVVVGAGLLGIDLAAICGAHDVAAHYLMRGDRWWRYALTAEGAEIIHDALRGIGVTPVFESGVARFETDDDGRVTAAIDPDGDRYACDWAGVAIGLDLNTEILQDTAVECDDGVVVDEYMQTSAEDVYAAGDLTRFYDTILDDDAQNGSWGSAKAQGTVAARNMVDPGSEAFRWVSSYSITHFDVPVLSFGHPTIGEEHAERRYGETEWRRLAFVDGRIVGGVLIGDLSPQSAYKRLMREECRVADRADRLLKKRVDAEEFLPAEE